MLTNIKKAIQRVDTFFFIFYIVIMNHVNMQKLAFETVNIEIC